MDKKFLIEWQTISSAVRAAIMAGNYGWTIGFNKAYYAVSKTNMTAESLRQNPVFAVEPISGSKGSEAVFMLLFLPNGHCYEAKLLDESGRVLLLWLHQDNWRHRPLVSLASHFKAKKNRRVVDDNYRAAPHTAPAAQCSDEALSDYEKGLIESDASLTK